MNLEEYYNKFNEDKRLDSLRGQVEYLTSMKYIRECLKSFEKPKTVEKSSEDIDMPDFFNRRHG